MLRGRLDYEDILDGRYRIYWERTIPELMGAGHTVLGLTRSEEGAKKLQAAGVEVHHGNIKDLDSLRKGAEKVDGVIHCAMNHDFSQFVKN